MAPRPAIRRRPAPSSSAPIAARRTCPALLEAVGAARPAARRVHRRRQRPRRAGLARRDRGRRRDLRPRGPPRPRPRPHGGAARGALRPRRVHRRRLRARRRTGSRDLGELFAPAAVAAVTGPAFAWELESPAQLRFELEGGFSRGLHRRHFDWTTISPLDAGAVGAGANMIFRRSVLAASRRPVSRRARRRHADAVGRRHVRALPGAGGGPPRRLRPGDVRVPPPPARSRRAAPRVLGLRRRAVGGHDQAARRGAASSRRRASWMWLWRQYRTAVLRRLAGKADARHVRVAWDYLRGGFAGPRAWRAARRELGPAERRRAGAGRGRPARRAAPHAPGRRADAAGGLGRGAHASGGPRRSRAASRRWRAQRDAGAIEVIVVDDGVPRRRRRRSDGATSSCARGGRGAAAARNLGARAARGRAPAVPRRRPRPRARPRRPAPRPATTGGRARSSATARPARATPGWPSRPPRCGGTTTSS